MFIRRLSSPLLFFFSSSHFFSPAPRITRSSPEHNATRSCVSIVRPARPAKGPMVVVVFAVKASAVRHREGVVDGGPAVGEGGVGVVGRTTDRGGRGLPKRKHAYYSLLSSSYSRHRRRRHRWVLDKYVFDSDDIII